VTLRGGVFFTGTILLKSNVTLNIESGAKLVGSPRIGDYLVSPFRHKKNSAGTYPCRESPKCRNYRPGEIEGNGEAFEGNV